MANGDILIPAQFIKVNSYLHNGNIRIVSGIRIVGSDGVGEVYKVINGVKTLIAVTNALGKDDSISCVVDDAGKLIIDVSEADAGGGGITCAGRVYEFPGLLPPKPPVTIGGTVDTLLRGVVKNAFIGIRNVLNTYIAQIP